MKQAIFLFVFLFLINFIHADCLENQIDINSASAKDLEKLTGIGPSYAQRIVDSRPFSSIDDLTKVNGIGPATLEKIKQQDLACVSFSEIINFPETNPEPETTQTETLPEQEKQQPIKLEPSKINLNTASETELTKITGVGQATAKLIIEARPFCSVDQLLDIKGIGPASLEKIKQQDLAFVEPCETQQQTLEIQDSVTETPQKTQTSTTQTANSETESVIKLANQQQTDKTITGKVVYESKTEVVRKYAIYAFSILLLILLFLVLRK